MSVGKIVVTGARGFLGRHVMPILHHRYASDKIVGLCRKDYDLLDPGAVHQMFEDHKPDALIHLAAYSGGIGANRTYPADFFHQNALFVTLVFQAAAEHKVKKMIYTMGGCSYPATASSPIGESQMWQGYPQHESAGYSVAKKMGLVASASYRAQYGLNSVVLIPGNMYGEYDNFRTQESHVIPALIRRFYEARAARKPEVQAWGSGKPVRDFVYAGDVAATIPFFLENYDVSAPVNISSGTTTSIKELTETVAKQLGYTGKIAWDTSKPDGQMEKIFDVSRLHGLGLSCSTPLEEGIHKTAAWLEKNYECRGDGIRL